MTLHPKPGPAAAAAAAGATLLTLLASSPAQALPLVRDVVETLKKSSDADWSRVLGLGLAVPGPFDVEGLSAVGPTTLPGWQDLSIADQIGQAIGGLAVEVVGSTDIGLPLTPTGRAALLPANIAAFGAGLEVPADQVRLYLALREAAQCELGRRKGRKVRAAPARGRRPRQDDRAGVAGTHVGQDRTSRGESP